MNDSPASERTYSYGELETLLAAVHGLQTVQRAAFRGVLKHLGKFNFLSPERPGKGRDVRYVARDVARVALALELLQIGLDPTEAIEIVSRLVPEQLLADAARSETTTLLVLPVAMMTARMLRRPVHRFTPEIVVQAKPEYVRGAVGSARQITINLTALANSIRLNGGPSF